MERNKTIDMEKTGKVLSQKFMEKKMSYTEVASLLGVSISTVSYWMNGKKLPSLSHIMEIVQILDCTVEDIILLKQKNGDAKYGSCNYQRIK